MGRAIALAEVADGASNTLLMSEAVVARGHDLRGLTWWGLTSGFVSSLRPNDPAPDVHWVSSAWCDPSPPNPPCAPGVAPFVLAARSRHPGGVNAARCDGSVAFVPDAIAPGVWQALSTTAGGEATAGE